MPHASEITVGNFDFTITPSGQVKLFECGPGICGVGYEGYEPANGATMHEQIFMHLLERFDKLLIVNYGSNLLLRLCSETFERNNRARFERFNSLDDIKIYVQQHPDLNAAILVDRINALPQYRHMTEPRVATRCQALALSLPIISSSDMYRILGDKAFFADIFGHHLPDAIPKSWILDRTSVESRLQELLSTPIDWFIVKAPQGNRAEGSSIFHRTDLPFLCMALQNKSIEELKTHGASEHQLIAIDELIQMLNSPCDNDIFLIQEVIIPTLREDNRAQTHACTGRFVFSCERNEEGVKTTLIDAMWKYALLPFSGHTPPNPTEIISCVLKKKLKNLAANQSVLLTTEKIEQHYTALLNDDEKGIVQGFVEHDLSQFFAQFSGDLNAFISHSNDILSPETRHYLAKNLEYIACVRPLESQFKRHFSNTSPSLPVYRITRLNSALLLLATGIEQLKAGRNALAKDNLEAACQLSTDLLIEPHTQTEKNTIIQGLATAHYNLATAYGRLGDNPKAYHHCLHALIHRVSLDVDSATLDRTQRKLIDLLPVSDSQNPVGPLYDSAIKDFKKADYEHAIKKLLIAKALYNTVHDNLSLSHVFSTLASCYRELGDYLQAENACENGLALLNELPEKDTQVIQSMTEKLVDKREGIKHRSESDETSPAARRV